MPFPRRSRVLLLLGLALPAGLAGWRFWPSSQLAELVYATPDGTPLTLDLDFPRPFKPPSPLVLLAPPDGEWPRALKWEKRTRTLLARLSARGYAVATIHYRLPGKYRFPAQIEDIKSAVRWLRANADRYGLAADRIGAVGVSSGGYGVSMLGTTDPHDGFDGHGDNLEQSSRVQAVVCLGVPGDFAEKVWPERLENIYLRPFLGAGYADDPELYARASPGSYASADDPPFLLFHSRNDLVVPVRMARTFAERLQRAGVSVKLVEDEGLEHVWTGPRLDRAIEQTLDFFDEHVRGE
jgi:acetyl esterase/lipase